MPFFLILIISLGTNFSLLPTLLFNSIVILTIFQYFISAARISYIFQDVSSMYLVVIYFTRAVAWTIGGAISLIQTALTDSGNK